jgi:hypothetical protein
MDFPPSEWIVEWIVFWWKIIAALTNQKAVRIEKNCVI